MPAESINYLKSLRAIRDRSQEVLQLGLQGKLSHFTVHPERLNELGQFLIELIERDYGPTKGGEQILANTIDKIPPHGRWRHFGEENIARLMARIGGEQTSLCSTRMILDLFVLAVLLDAGAGDKWRYYDATSQKVYQRSEGLAVASLRMFEKGIFSNYGNADPLRVDAAALSKLQEDVLSLAMQVSPENPLVGLSGRVELLRRLGRVLESKPQYFASDPQQGIRPSGMLDYLRSRALGDRQEIPLEALWEVIVEGLSEVWPPTRTTLDGIPLGDVWPCAALNNTLVPFHKLSQWLAFSLIEPLERLAGFHINGTEQLTCLAEYRNGGLLVDFGVISLREESHARGLVPQQGENKSSAERIPTYEVHDQVIVEWRALTVALIDRLADELCHQLGLDKKKFPLAKILEAGTWKAGRELAKRERPLSASPPIGIISDGTLF